jgi:hypothetical protein
MGNNCAQQHQSTTGGNKSGVYRCHTHGSLLWHTPPKFDYLRGSMGKHTAPGQTLCLCLPHSTRPSCKSRRDTLRCSPSSRGFLPSKRGQNLCQPEGLALMACSSRGCREKEARRGAAPLRRKVTGGEPPRWAGQGIPGPVVWCNPSCRCNQRRTRAARGTRRLDQRLLHGLPLDASVRPPARHRPFVNANRDDHGLHWTAVSKQREHKTYRLDRGAQAVQRRALRGGARLLALRAETPLVRTRMDTKSALACLTSGGTRQVGAECGCGVHVSPPHVALTCAKKRMAGPLFFVQPAHTTGKCGATPGVTIAKKCTGGRLSAHAARPASGS